MANPDGRSKFNRDPDSLVDHVLKNAKKGDPEDFLRIIDEFCSKNEPHMNVGDTKGPLLDEIFRESDPVIAVQLGSYIGYNAVRMARMMMSAGKFYAIEVDQKLADFVRKMTNHAGVGQKVTIINESTETAIPLLKERHGITKIDFVFIDHKKSLYKADLIRLIDAGLLSKGSVVVADKVASQDTSDYLEFVRNNPRFISKHFDLTSENSPGTKDGLEKSVFVG